jgi:hypothetical protein
MRTDLPMAQMESRPYVGGAVRTDRRQVLQFAAPTLIFTTVTVGSGHACLLA